MSERMTGMLDEVLRLSESERTAFVERLLDSFDAPPSDIDRMSDEDFAAELERRHEEAQRDPSALIPWNQVRDMR